MGTFEDLVAALDGAVDGIRLYDEAPPGAEPPYMTYALKLTNTVYAGDAVLARFWRYDVRIWQEETDRDLIARVVGALERAGLYGEAYHYPDDDEGQSYTVVETAVTESS